MKGWLTTTRLLVGIAIAAIGVVIGLVIGSDGDEASNAERAVRELAEQQGDVQDDGGSDTEPPTEDLGFEAGLAALDADESLRTIVVTSNAASRLQSDALDALDRGLVRLGNGDGEGAAAMFDQRAGANVNALDRVVEAERELHSLAGEQIDRLSEVLDQTEDLEDLMPLEEAASEALVSLQELISLDEDVAALVGAMRSSLLDNRVSRYESQAFELAGLLADAEAAGVAANEGLAELNEAFADAAEALEGYGVDRAALRD